MQLTAHKIDALLNALEEQYQKELTTSTRDRCAILRRASVATRRIHNEYSDKVYVTDPVTGEVLSYRDAHSHLLMLHDEWWHVPSGKAGQHYKELAEAVIQAAGTKATIEVNPAWFEEIERLAYDSR